MIDTTKGFFDNYKYCKDCKRLLPEDYELDLCENCLEDHLFREVRDYIRKNDVTEYDVADYFQLPLRRVRSWIREGRIQYSKDDNKKVIGMHCGRCGELITRGHFCPKCLAYMKNNRGVGMNMEDMDNSKMRFLDENGKWK